MFIMLEQKTEISKAQQQLELTIRSNFKTKENRRITHPGPDGGRDDAQIITNGTHWFYTDDYYSSDTPSPRRLNWFGLFKKEGALDIVVEINMAHQGINGRLAGFFAREIGSGTVCLFHSGRVGGGTKGVGKMAFMAWSSCRMQDVVDSNGRHWQGALVMRLTGSNATHSTENYIDLINGFKQAVRNGETKTAKFKSNLEKYKNFYSESHGQRRRRAIQSVDYVSRHGEVVDALEKWRIGSSAKNSIRSVKSILIDLGIEVNSKLVEIYEVKSSASRQEIYCAIGQLLVHGRTEGCRRFLVIPAEDKLPPDLTTALNRLEISLIQFKLEKKQVLIV